MNSPAKKSFLHRILGAIARRPGSLPRAAVRAARRAVTLCHALMQLDEVGLGRILAVDIGDASHGFRVRGEFLHQQVEPAFSNVRSSP